jgi:hypothetical protein
MLYIDLYEAAIALEVGLEFIPIIAVYLSWRLSFEGSKLRMMAFEPSLNSCVLKI